MKNILSVLLLIPLILAGCQDPVDVEVIPDPDSDVEITPIVDPDSTVSRGSFDSTAVYPRDHERFGGLVTLNRMVYDGGFRGIESTAVSRIFFADRSLPVVHQGRIFGYFGFDLGVILLNGSEMNRIPHRVRLRRFLLDSLIVAGYEYEKQAEGLYAPNTLYRWTGTGLDLTVTTPDDLHVISPPGGSVIRRDRDLVLSWTGSGGVMIVISIYDRQGRMARPLIRVRPRPDRNRAVLSSKVLQALPGSGTYVFSFIRANRIESNVVAGYPNPILVQAAAVYNSYVELR